jgi:hypothetical protein
MSPPPPSDLPLESVIYRDGNSIRAVLAAQITCYFDRLDGQVAAGLVAAYQLVRPYLDPHMTWFRTESQSQSRRIRAADLAAFTAWFSEIEPDRDEYEMVMGSGNAIGEIGEWGFSFSLDRTSLPGVMGWLQVSFPVVFATQRTKEFKDIALGLFDCVEWKNGLAGYGTLFDHGDIYPKRNAAIRLFSLRHLGVDCNDLLAESELSAHLIKTVNWLTFVDTALGATIGLDTASPGSTATVEVLRRMNGYVVQAGRHPCLGSRDHPEREMLAYKAADALLRPIRATSIFPLPGFSDESDTGAWLQRFEQLPLRPTR